MSSTKREADSAAPAGDSATPSKRPRTDQGPKTAASTLAATESNINKTQDAPSSPFNPKETDSPSVRGGKKDRGGGGRGKRGNGRGGRGGRGGGDSRSWGGRNTGKGEANMRQWGKKEGDSEGGAPTGEGAKGDDDKDKKDKLPKRKVAALIGYNGINYKGSQVNPGTETIEGEVFKGLVKAGAISEDNSTNHQKVSLARAARTDAGVHAALNVLSLKLILHPPEMPADSSFADWVNQFLPPAIRLWTTVRVQGAFDPRKLCDQRQYEYTLPTHVFLGPKPSSEMGKWLEKARSTPPAVDGAEPQPPITSPIIEASAEFWSSRPEKSAFSEDVEAKKKWRISKEALDQAREFVKAYEGSHNYYNFTVGKDFRDRSCQRVMRKLDISEPFVVNDTEYVSVSFLGQSFMLHQIRKMIGLTILAVRSSTPASLVPETFGPSRIHIPKAPSLGLLLLEPQYIEYNKRVTEANSKLEDLHKADRLSEKDLADQRREPLDTKGLGLTDKIDEFKKEHVYKRMRQVEEDELTFSKWLNYLDVHIGSDFEYLNPKGVIPASAVYKKGENPERPRGIVADANEGEPALPPSDDEGAGAGEDDG
ncbi:pseudouridine synthase family protein [Sporobolomyces salmoneus]|uniref:pseudouridine synthase family protein n=1 Tax=Sporobolomyces salmoneus TaxID=183962 RepID=UPI00317E8B3B